MIKYLEIKQLIFFENNIETASASAFCQIKNTRQNAKQHFKKFLNFLKCYLF